MKKNHKFIEFYALYLEEKYGNRQERYHKAELKYQENRGQEAYGDYRKFAALLSMQHAKEMPHYSTANANLKQKYEKAPEKR